MNPRRLCKEWEDIGLHARSRTSYDPGERLTVTGFKLCSFICCRAARGEVNHILKRLLNTELSWLFSQTVRPMHAQSRPDFRFLKCKNVNDKHGR